MSARNTLRSFRPLPPPTPHPPTPTTTATHSRPRQPTKSRQQRRREGYPDFHPVTSTLVILGCGLTGFFVVFGLAWRVCVYWGV